MTETCFFFFVLKKREGKKIVKYNHIKLNPNFLVDYTSVYQKIALYSAYNVPLSRPICSLLL